MIERISCAVDTGKWSENFLQPGIFYDDCDSKDDFGLDIVDEFRDSLFVNVTVDDFLFNGYKSGAIRIVQQQMIESWGLDDPNSFFSGFIHDIFGFDYPLVRKPYVLQNGTDGEFRFAALNTKSGTTHNE